MITPPTPQQILEIVHIRRGHCPPRPRGSLAERCGWGASVPCEPCLLEYLSAAIRAHVDAATEQRHGAKGRRSCAP